MSQPRQPNIIIPIQVIEKTTIQVPYPIPSKGTCELCDEKTVITHSKKDGTNRGRGSLWKHLISDHQVGNRGSVRPYCIYDGKEFQSWIQAEIHDKEVHKGAKYEFLVRTEGRVTREEVTKSKLDFNDFFITPKTAMKAELESQIIRDHQPPSDWRINQRMLFEKYGKPFQAHMSTLKWSFPCKHGLEKIVMEAKPDSDEDNEGEGTSSTQGSIFY